MAACLPHNVYGDCGICRLNEAISILREMLGPVVVLGAPEPGAEPEPEPGAPARHGAP